VLYDRFQKELEPHGIKVVTYFGDTSELERQANEAAFNCDPTVRVLIGNPQTCGEGVNLVGYDTRNPTTSHTNCDHVGFFSQGWRPLLRAQSEGRPYRKSTRVPIQFTDYVVPGTIDEEIRVRVLEKRISAMRIQDLREILKTILE